MTPRPRERYGQLVPHAVAMHVIDWSKSDWQGGESQPRSHEHIVEGVLEQVVPHVLHTPE
jgi:hypothetical protein